MFQEKNYRAKCFSNPVPRKKLCLKMFPSKIFFKPRKVLCSKEKNYRAKNFSFRLFYFSSAFFILSFLPLSCYPLFIFLLSTFYVFDT